MFQVYSKVIQCYIYIYRYIYRYIYIFKFIFLFFWLHRVLVAGHGIFVEACGIFPLRRAICLGFSLVVACGLSLVVVHRLQGAWALWVAACGLSH